MRRRKISWEGSGSQALAQLSTHYFGGTEPGPEVATGERAG
jgi:hypothetical protein